MFERQGAEPECGLPGPASTSECIDHKPGWYTFKHTFSSKAGYLDVLMKIIPVGSSSAVASWDITGQDA